MPAPAVSPSKAWSQALERTASISANPDRILPTVLSEVAAGAADAPALLSETEQLTFADLVGRANQYARWAVAQDLRQGDTVALLMPNRPEYFAIWLGITQVGGVVALLNVHQTGAALAHSINIVAPAHIIVDGTLSDSLIGALSEIDGSPQVWGYGRGSADARPIDIDVVTRSTEALGPHERRRVTIDDRALYIYTSGTTGLPKAAAITHARLMQWTHWFAGMMDVVPGDRMYNCLPMYHSVGGVLSIGSVLVGGGSVVVKERFSVAHFWRDVARWECTLFQYIGELCRYLVLADPDPCEHRHRLRLCCGNGLRGDVWDRFKERFKIPHILEFYASTEGNVSLFNIEGRPGAVGRIPGYLAHRFPAALVRVDPDSGEPTRDAAGYCQRCAPDETGEAIGQLLADASNIGSRFDGYTSRADSEKKMLRNVFKAGDAWVRTGDLMRRDARGFFFFVDRVGDTFRWKGENVATSEVAQTICSYPGVREAIVYGVTIPSADGRAGMAAIVADDEIDPAALWRHLADRLPKYACPLFLRLRQEMEVTGTFKYLKSDLLREGYDPAVVSDALYFNSSTAESFVPIDQHLYAGICSGQIRV